MTEKFITHLFKDSSSFDEDMKIVKEIRSLSDYLLPLVEDEHGAFSLN